MTDCWPLAGKSCFAAGCLGVMYLCAVFGDPWLLVSCAVSGAVQLKPLKKRALPGVPLFYTAIEELYEVRPHPHLPSSDAGGGGGGGDTCVCLCSLVWERAAKHELTRALTKLIWQASLRIVPDDVYGRMTRRGFTAT